MLHNSNGIAISVILITLIFLFYINKIVPQLIPFLPTQPVVIDKVPSSGTVPAKINTPIEVKRFALELQRCEKIETSALECYFTVTNKAGDRVFGLRSRESRIVENTRDILNGKSVQISKNSPRSYSRLDLISNIPTKAIFSFGGVGKDAKSVAALEAAFEVAGTPFKIQYRNVPLT